MEMSIFKYVERNEIDIVKRILEDDLKLKHLRDSHGNTPLHYACQNGRVSMASVLLENLPCLARVRDREKGIPLHDTRWSKNILLSKILLEVYPEGVLVQDALECKPLCLQGYISTIELFYVKYEEDKETIKYFDMSNYTRILNDKSLERLVLRRINLLKR